MIKERYKYHLSSTNQEERYQKLRAAFSNLEDLITECCPPGREQSLSKTNLEQAAMWANKSIALENINPEA